MPDEAKVIPFPTARKAASSPDTAIRSSAELHRHQAGRATDIEEFGKFVLRTADDILRANELPSSADWISIDRLYPAPQLGRPELRSAFRLLDAALSRTDGAIAAAKSGDFIQSDLEMQQTQSLLPELFCCRSLGDGFGAISNAITLGIANRRGVALTLPQLMKLRDAFAVLREHPFLAFDAAIDIIARLEDSGLAVDPQALESLIGDIVDV